MEFKKWLEVMATPGAPTPVTPGMPPQQNNQDLQMAVTKAMQGKQGAQAALKAALNAKMQQKNMTPQQLADLAKMADQMNGVQ